jgi:hypothetical protein
LWLEGIVTGMQIRTKSHGTGREEPTAAQILIGHDFISSALVSHDRKDGAGIERRHLYPDRAELDLEM